MQDSKYLQGGTGKITLEEMVKQLQNVFLKMHKHSLPYTINSDGKFDTNIQLVYTALYNMVKNSLQAVDRRERLISVSISDYSGEAGNLAYKAPSTAVSGDFIKFEVIDNGRGFPQDREINEFLKLGVSSDKGDKGFGLYYVYLVCKYLESHLAIDSKKGDTKVAIYHPLSQ